MWDGGIDWWLGINKMIYPYGEKCVRGNAKTVDDAVQEIMKAAKKKYPNAKIFS